MLVLTRRVDEVLVIYEGNRKIAEVTLLGVRGQQARLGLEASRDITFVRAELIGEGIVKVSEPEKSNDPA